ncbi:MAG: TRAP transporter substrate-binding protein [Firmicutes bacterium]|nr:TRAP transporter substrate-binding protein [Bacillota bacterium]
MKWKILVLPLLIGLLLIGGFGAEAKMIFKLATAYPPGNEAVVVAEKFAELVAGKSDGAIEVQVFSGGAMGGERDTIQALKMGSVQGVTSGMMPVHMFAHKYGFMDAPYVMRDYDHWKSVWQGAIGEEVRQILLDNRIMVAGIYYRGVRHITANKPITKPEDLAGIKMRVPQDPSWVKIWQELGTLPTVVALPELFTALQTGVADASEGPASQLTSYRLNEVQKYLVLSGHMVAVGVFMLNEPFIKGLNEKDRSIILEAAREAAEYGDRWALETEAKLIAQLQEGGMTPIVPDAAALQEKARPAITDLFASEWDVTTWDEILSY